MKCQPLLTSRCVIRQGTVFQYHFPQCVWQTPTSPTESRWVTGGPTVASLSSTPMVHSGLRTGLEVNIPFAFIYWSSGRSLQKLRGRRKLNDSWTISSQVTIRLIEWKEEIKSVNILNFQLSMLVVKQTSLSLNLNDNIISCTAQIQNIAYEACMDSIEWRENHICTAQHNHYAI